VVKPTIKPVSKPASRKGKTPFIFLPPSSFKELKEGKGKGQMPATVFSGGVPDRLKPLKRKWLKWAGVESLAFSPHSTERERRKCHAFFLTISVVYGYIWRKSMKWISYLRRTKNRSTKMKCMTRFIRCASSMGGTMDALDDLDRKYVDPLMWVDQLAKHYRSQYPSATFADPKYFPVWGNKFYKDI